MRIAFAELEVRRGSARVSLVPIVPDHISALLFDLDGVLTQTAKLHAAAWKQMFDDFLRARAQRTGEQAPLFELPRDYDRSVDGKLRLDGVRSFLATRGIVLPEGSARDGPAVDSVHGLGARKNELVLRLIRDRGVERYDGSVRFAEAVRDRGYRRAVVSSSKNCEAVLVSAGISDLFEVRIDGVVAEREGFRGKPAPDMFLAAARALDVEPAGAAVFEDALAGVQAGRAGGFGWVVGVDRTGQADVLASHGADIVVQDLSELLEER
jgi:beta-phosphoglucomutase family hydrolase